MEKNSTFAFVMAGGSGERFWPMSRRTTPKHLLRLLGDQTLLETTVRRLEGVVPLENTFILTNEAQLESTRAAVPFLPARNILAEPAKRDTAPACALATAVARAIHPDAVCVVLPADAMIHDVAKFRDRLADAIETADTSGSIVTLGIPPTHPATGYGYLEAGAARPAGARGSRVHTLGRFVEKPDLEKATAYLREGTFFWNAGIFVWKASVFLDEARRQLPPLADFIEALDSFDALPDLLASRFAALPKISVDYAVMENARDVATVLADFDWDDVGAWTALPAHIPPDANGNSSRGAVVQTASSGNIAVSNGRLVALCGVDNLVVVETPDAILVCHRDAVQKVKDLQPLLPEELK
ncbi:MAG: mannose-1-phosphate guanylyltransferase [Verrucomicrobiota bacterium]